MLSTEAILLFPPENESSAIAPSRYPWTCYEDQILYEDFVPQFFAVSPCSLRNNVDAA